MIILSDCFTEKIDEGCLKVANSLTRKIKRKYSDSMVISYDRKPADSDCHLQLNKLFLNHSFLSLIRKKKEAVLYIPFASNTTASCIRTFILSRFAKRGVSVIFVLRFPMDKIAKIFLKWSKANVIALSQESFDFYKDILGNRAIYLKTGIDTKKFTPVSNEQKEKLREKYHVAPGKKVLLHVGHLKEGRNVDKLLTVKEDYHVFLIVSSVTECEKDNALRERLNNRPDTTIIDSYLEHIEEVYQMADVYLFPVMKNTNCIDVPLSVLEAAACNVPIVTTAYGELKSFQKEPGFLFVDDFQKDKLNEAIDKMAGMEVSNREAVLDYDWEHSINELESILRKK